MVVRLRNCDSVVLLQSCLINAGTIEEYHRDGFSVIAATGCWTKGAPPHAIPPASLRSTYLWENPLRGGPSKPTNKKTGAFTRTVHPLFQDTPRVSPFFRRTASLRWPSYIVVFCTASRAVGLDCLLLRNTWPHLRP